MNNADALREPESIERQLDAALDAVRNMPKVENVFLVGCGGSYAKMLPAEYILQSRSKTMATHALNAREFTTRKPGTLGANSLVIACSHSGSTPETVDAVNLARESGASTIAFTHFPESALDAVTQNAIYYQHGEEKKYSYTNSALLFRLVFGVLDIAEDTDHSGAAKDAVMALDAIIAAEVAESSTRADDWAKRYKRSEVIYTMGSGANYGEAYSFAVCFLMEMLWVHSSAINSAEYFHGPFEVTDFDVPFLQVMGLGGTREIDERSYQFANKHSDEVHCVDASSWNLNEVKEELRPDFAHLVLGPVLRLYADRLADHKGHPLSVRRYMWRMEY